MILIGIALVVIYLLWNRNQEGMTQMSKAQMLKALVKKQSTPYSKTWWQTRATKGQVKWAYDKEFPVESRIPRAMLPDDLGQLGKVNNSLAKKSSKGTNALM